jgi:thioredoxin 1
MKVLKFYADWCGPCKALTRIIEIAGEKVTIPVENVNIDENIFLAQEFKVRSVPTMILVDDTENEIKRHVGLVNEEKLLEFLKG